MTAAEQPEGPLLLQTGGGSETTDGDGVVMHQSYWLWPLPEPGRLRLSCEWPVVGIGLTTTEIDVSTLVEAAARTVSPWR